MYIQMDTTQVEGGSVFGPLPEEEARKQAMHWPGDIVDISEEAIKAFRETAIEPIKNGTFTLDRLEQRINTVRAEIAQIWGSALPDNEKHMQISARENEISLLQAGQFTFAKAGFPLSV
ncbi:MAG TPA: hypothetical protein VKA04_12845 [Pseudodesulfovibrio sp.]|nr:hypothetical protein [Pseudodesulfovibrio sp.]